MDRHLLGKEDPSQNIPTDVATGNRTTILKSDEFFKGVCQVILAMGLGSIISTLLHFSGIKFPSYLGAMFAAAIFRNIAAFTGTFKIRSHEICVIGDASLSLFVAMAPVGNCFNSHCRRVFSNSVSFNACR